MTDASDTPRGSRLEHFPVTFFAVIMGMAGVTLALAAGENAYGLGSQLSGVVFGITVFLFLLMGMGYVAKALQHPRSVLEEWRHPVRMAFFPAISISLLLLAAATLTRDRQIAEFLWLVGAVTQALLTIAVISGWIGARAFQTGHLSPAWFIPAVGNVIAPIAGVPLGYFELSWYFMSVGLIFWIVLMTLVINRLIFHDPLPGRLQPTLVILIAPPPWPLLHGCAFTERSMHSRGFCSTAPISLC